MKVCGRLGHAVLAAAALAMLLTPRPAWPLDKHRLLTQYILDSWTAKEGLRQHGVMDIVQTPEGYLWLATNDGLVRFDGMRFTTFGPRGTAGYDADAFSYTIAAAPDGSIWLGTYHGLVHLRNGVFRTYYKEDGLVDSFVQSVTIDTAGDVWAGGYTGLARRRGERFEAEPRLAGKNIGSVVAARGGGVWVGVQGAVYRLNGEQTTIYAAREGVPPELMILRLYESPDGTLWIASEQGLGRIAGGTARLFTTRDGLASDTVVDVLTDRDGTIWVATGEGLNRFEGDRLSRPLRAEGLADHRIESLLEDRDGSLWIGTRTRGLHRLRDGVFLPYGQPEGLPEDYMWSIHTSADGRVWIGSAGGAAVLERDGRVRVFTSEQGLPGNNVLALCEARDGMWLGLNTGLVRIDGRGLRRYGAADGLNPPFVRAIHEDARGRLWLGTGGGGVYRREGDRFVALPPPPGAPAAAYVSTIVGGRGGVVWFGTDHGLWKLEGELLRAYTRKEGLPGEYVSAIFEDEDGAVWVAANPGGIARFEKGRFSVYRIDAGLHDEPVHAIVGDARRRLWFLSDRGVLSVERRALDDYAEGRTRVVVSTAFDTRDGLRVVEGNGGGTPAAWRAPDGRLWFATAGGAVVVDPDRVKRDTAPPAAFIEELIVDGRAMPLSDGVEVAPGAGRLEIRYTAASLRVPDRVRFRFRLEDFEAAWSEPTDRRTAYYTNIPPGRYRFVVSASLDGGPWGAPEAALSFRLQPRFYQTGWFRALGVALLGAAVAGVHRWRVRRLARREAELARRVEEALKQIKTLRGMLPVCASCKKIRDDRGYWSQMETYIAQHTAADFSHGICPECVAKLYPEYVSKIAEEE